MIKNFSKGKKLNLTIINLDSWKDKIFGALKYKKEALILETGFGIHTFFVENPLEIAILDKKSRVIKLKKVPPNRIFLWNPKYRRVLELPYGSINILDLEIGDILEFL